MVREKRNALLKFILLYIVSILLLVIIFSVYSKSGLKNEGENTDGLLKANELLNDYLVQITNQNEKYVATLEFPLSVTARDSVLRTQAEFKTVVNKKIDSILTTAKDYNQQTQARYNYSILQFQTAFKNLEAANYRVLSTEGPDTSFVVSLSRELRLKDARIATLENLLKAAQQAPKVEKTTVISSPKDQEEIKFLKWAVRSQVITIKNLEEKLKKQ